MACVTRNATKLLPNFSTYASRTRALKESHRRFVSTLNSSHMCIMRSLSPPHKVTPFLGAWQWRFLHSDGDKDLANFLGKEIKLEEVKVPDLPKIKEFSMKTDGTLVTLERDYETERISVEFNIRDNVRVPTEDFNKYVADLENCVDYQDHEDIEDVAGLFQELFEDWAHECSPSRYPVFRIYIQKSTGNTICFHCALNTQINENVALCEGVSMDIGDDDFLLLKKVEAYGWEGEENTVVTRNLYVGRFDVRPCGGELKALLLNTLLERGIDGDFVNKLAELASAVEHRHYIGFMKSLSKYVSEE